MGNLKRIMIGEKTYPYKIDLNVLEHIQENYNTINQFERDLIGLRFKKDAEGNQVYNGDGDPVMIKTEPSIKAIKTVLPAAINEGLAIEADEENKSFTKITEEFVIRECTIPFDVLAVMLHEEFKRCFATKK